MLEAEKESVRETFQKENSKKMRRGRKEPKDLVNVVVDHWLEHYGVKTGMSESEKYEAIAKLVNDMMASFEEIFPQQTGRMELTSVGVDGFLKSGRGKTYSK